MKKPNSTVDRRSFLQTSVAASLGTLIWNRSFLKGAQPGEMRFGLVTYQWGKDWDLPTLISNCEEANYAGVELRTQHAHGVEPVLSASQREEVKKRFEDSPVECVGYGSNQEYHSADPNELRENINGTLELIKLSHDIGATGVKVKPNTLPEGVPPEKTIAQIGRSLNEVGRFASDYGQLIRVEVHGRKTSEIPVMKAIFDHVEEESVGICWNCNAQDLLPPGLGPNFDLLRDRFGDTMHVRELDSEDYPYQDLIKLLTASNYAGWILLEARTEPSDRVEAMKDQLALFRKMVSEARKTP